jgi:glycosyltransferase involved in cell wall biosynthesis
VHSFSGVSEEVLRSVENTPTKRLLVRGSAHIRAQAALLQEEQRRTGIRLDRPSAWMIEREEREYALADNIVTLSTFARNSFLARSVAAEKLALLPLGAQLESFRPSRDTVETRCDRIVSGEPLRILYVGALSFQKGLWDMASIVDELRSENFRFRCVGPIAAESAAFVRSLPAHVEMIPKQPQKELSRSYAWGDVFVFPTIQDGFAVVLAQAQASALPILTTTNCCGPDIVRDGETGWVFPIRSPEAFVKRLRWCDGHRVELANMVRFLVEEFQPRSWADVAKDFERLCAGITVANGN